MAFTNREKTARRIESLNQLAQALGYETWRKLETDLKRKFEKGEQIHLVLKSPQATSGD